MADSEHGRSGQCLCGSVSYRATEVAEEVLQCHCQNCRRLTGNFVAVVSTATADLAIESDDGSFRWFDLEYARYGFCRECGSTLFYQAADKRERTSIMVGTLDDAAGLRLHQIWFAVEAQPHNTLPTDVAHFDGNG